MFRKKQATLSVLRGDLDAELDKVRDGELLLRAEAAGTAIGREDPEGWARELAELIREQNARTEDAATDGERRVSELTEHLEYLRELIQRRQQRYQQLSKHPVTGGNIDVARLKPNPLANYLLLAVFFLLDLVVTTRMATFIFGLTAAKGFLTAVGLAGSVAYLAHLVAEEVRPALGRPSRGPYRILLAAIAGAWLVAAVTFGVLRGYAVWKMAGLPPVPTTLFYVAVSLAIPAVAGIQFHRFWAATKLVKPLLELEKQIARARLEVALTEQVLARLVEWLVDLPTWHRDRIEQLVVTFTSACDWGFSHPKRWLGIFPRKRRPAQVRPWDVPVQNWPDELRRAYDEAMTKASELEGKYESAPWNPADKKRETPGQNA